VCLESGNRGERDAFTRIGHECTYLSSLHWRDVRFLADYPSSSAFASGGEQALSDLNSGYEVAEDEAGEVFFSLASWIQLRPVMTLSKTS